MELSLKNVLVFAPDLGIARRFYGEILGLRLARSGEGYLAFEGANFDLTVFACAHATEADGHSERAGSAIALQVPSLDRAIAELAAKGVRFLHAEPNEGPLGRYVAFADPFGTVHELVEGG